MTAHDFDQLVERACSRIPRRFRRRLANVAFVVEAEPSAEQLRAGRVPPGQTLLGLYRGRPLTQRSVSDSFVMPDQIVIFQGLNEIADEDADDVKRRGQPARHLRIVRGVQLFQEGRGGRADIDKHEVDEKVCKGLVVALFVGKQEVGRRRGIRL